MLVFLSGQNSLINTDLTSRCSCTQIILDVVFHLEFVSLSFSRIISLLPISVVGFCVCSHHFFLAFRSQLKFTKTNFFSMWSTFVGSPHFYFFLAFLVTLLIVFRVFVYQFEARTVRKRNKCETKKKYKMMS